MPRYIVVPKSSHGDKVFAAGEMSRKERLEILASGFAKRILKRLDNLG
jgi:hypothetical protein